MKNEAFLVLKTPVAATSQILDNLRISIDYQKGGVNWFSGNYHDGGVYVYLTPCSRKDGIIGQVITGKQHYDGYKILLKELNRKSQKQIDLMAEKVLPYGQQIADLYSDAKHQEIYNLIKSII